MRGGNVLWVRRVYVVPSGGHYVDPVAERSALEKYHKYDQRRIDVGTAELLALNMQFSNIKPNRRS